MMFSLILLTCLVLFQNHFAYGFKPPLRKTSISPPNTIAILPGSGVSPSLYHDLTKELEASLSDPVSVINLQYFPFHLHFSFYYPKTQIVMTQVICFLSKQLQVIAYLPKTPRKLHLQSIHNLPYPKR